MWQNNHNNQDSNTGVIRWFTRCEWLKELKIVIGRIGDILSSQLCASAVFMLCVRAVPFSGDLFGRLMKEDPSTIKGAEALMLGEMLTLPQNFG